MDDTQIKLAIDHTINSVIFLSAKCKGYRFTEWTRLELISSFNLNQIIKIMVLYIIKYLICDPQISELHKPCPYFLSIFNLFKTMININDYARLSCIHHSRSNTLTRYRSGYVSKWSQCQPYKGLSFWAI